MLLSQLKNDYLSVFPEEESRLRQMDDSLTASENKLFSRKTLPGHIVASGIAVRGNSLLMISHPYLKRWLQPGGHMEAGESPLQAAQREVLEETGIHTALHPWHKTHSIPFDIDIHTIPANPKKGESEHLHYDFRYLLIAQDNAEEVSELPHEWRNFSTIELANLRRVIDKLKLHRLC